MRKILSPIALMTTAALFSLPALDPQAGESKPHLNLLLPDLEKKATLEEALAWVSEQFPKFMESYTLLYKSRSAQQSESLNPRAIVYGEDATFVLAFNGNPKHRGYDSLEMIQFVESEDRFELRSVTYPTPSNGLSAPIVSEPNPAFCLKCHGKDPRPIWEQYSTWPGAFGSQDDQIIFGLGKEDQEKEWSDLKAFEKIQPKHPRYGQLKNFSKNYGQHEKDWRRLAAKPNITLTQAIAKNNFRKIHRTIRETPHYHHYKFAILGGILGCGEIDGFLPPALAQNHEPSLSDFERETLALAQKYGFKGDEDLITNLRFLFEGRGISMKEWSMALHRGTYQFTTPSRGLRYTALQMLELDPELRILELSESIILDTQMTSGKAFKGEICSKIRDRSLKQMANLGGQLRVQQPQVLTEKIDGPVGVCIQCHGGPRSAGPPIPFHDENQLADALKRKGYPRGSLLEEIEFRIGVHSGVDQMPPREPLESDHKLNLLIYLQSLLTRSESP